MMNGLNILLIFNVVFITDLLSQVIDKNDFIKNSSSISKSLSSEIIGTNYEVHEWGTFTSVYTSEGISLNGLQREEESLPNFVYSHIGLENGSKSNVDEKIMVDGNLLKLTDSNVNINNHDKRRKGMPLSREIRNCNLKMETPVIYFYSSKEIKAKVSVGFKNGTISQWYPQRSSGENLPVITYNKESGLKADVVDLKKFGNGNIVWDVEVLKNDRNYSSHIFKPDQTPLWIYPRNEKANTLKLSIKTDDKNDIKKEEYEKYLFYRGLSYQELPVKFKLDRYDTLTIKNNFKNKIPYLLVYERISELGKSGIRVYEISDGIES